MTPLHSTPDRPKRSNNNNNRNETKYNKSSENDDYKMTAAHLQEEEKRGSLLAAVMYMYMYLHLQGGRVYRMHSFVRVVSFSERVRFCKHLFKMMMGCHVRKFVGLDR